MTRRGSDTILKAVSSMPAEYIECRGIKHPYNVLIAEPRGRYFFVFMRCPNCNTEVTFELDLRDGSYKDKPRRSGTNDDYKILGYGQAATHIARGAARLAHYQSLAAELGNRQ